MAKNFWDNDKVAGDDNFWANDRPAAQQDLPAGVKPSTAGGGRGATPASAYARPAPSPAPAPAPAEPTTDPMGSGDFAAAVANPTGQERVSVLQDQPMDAPDAARRLSLGAGPISQQTATRAEQLVDGQNPGTQNRAVVERAARGMQTQVDAGQRNTFGDLVERANDPTTQRMARDQTAEEFRTIGEWAVDSSTALASGAVSLAQMVPNIVAPDSALSASLAKAQQGLKDMESAPMKARLQQLAERAKSEDGFVNQWAATVAELVTNPSVAVNETMRQVAMFAGVLGAAKLGGVAAGGAVGAAERVSPTLALGEAISGGAVRTAAQVGGAVAGGRLAASTMAAGDAAGATYEKLMAGDDQMWARNTEFADMVARGVPPEQAKTEIATAKARLGAMMAAPLGLLGFLGAEASFVGSMAGRTASRAPLRTLATEMVTEPAEEALTTMAGNTAVRTVNPEQEIAEGAGEAAGMATVTSAPFGAAAAVNEMRARPPVDRTEQIKALRAAGDKTAADLLQRRQDREMTAFTMERETEALQPFGPAVQQRYRELRAAGTKPGDAVTQTAMRTTFEDAAAAAGLSEKAREAALAKAATMDPDAAPGFLQKVMQAYAARGLAQPIDGADALATTIETQRDQLLDAVLAADIRPTMTAIEELEKGTAVAQNPASVAQTPEIVSREGEDFGSNDILVAPETDAVHQAATSPLNDRPEPTLAQKEAGNYKLGHVRIGGLDISIENPQGSVRRGTAPDGTTWETPMRDHYGYIRGTTAADGDKLDLFIKPGTPPDFSGTVFVVDQVDPATGKFDEAKVIFGATDQADAEATYLRNYSSGWKGLGTITALPMPAFKAWATSKQTSKPLGTLPTRTDAEVAPPQPTQREAARDEAPAAAGIDDAAPATGVSPAGDASAVEADGVTLKDGGRITISREPAPSAFTSLVRDQHGEPMVLIAKNERGEEVGRLSFMPNGGPIDSFVREKDRRRGVGSALYDALESAGGKIPPISSSFAISDDARALRAAREGRNAAPGLASADEQRRAAADVEKKRREKRARLTSNAWGQNPMRAFLAKHGVSSELASEFAPGAAERRKAMVPGYGPIFRKTGKNLDMLAEAAREEGFTQSEDVAELHDLIGRVFRGEKVIPVYAEGAAEQEMAARQAAMEEDARARFEDYADADPFAPDDQALLEEIGYDAADAAVQAEFRALIAAAEAEGIDTETLLEDAHYATREQSDDLYRQRATADLEAARSQRRETAGRPRAEPGREATEPGGREDGQPVPGPQSASRPEVTTTLRADGTLAVKGDAPSIRKLLADAGITNVLAMRGGVLVGKTSAAQAQALLDAPLLAAPTRAEVVARQDRTAKAAKDTAKKEADAKAADVRETERREVARRSEAAADSFELGQDGLDNLSGQQPMFARAGPTDSDAFKRWFGDSKVVDAGGQPLVVYHGTRRDFNEFKTLNDLGAHFGTREQAGVFVSEEEGGLYGGNILPVLLSIQNPLRLEDHGSFYAAKVVPQLQSLGILTKEVYESQFSGEDGVRALQRAIERAGYDGVVYANTQEGSGDSYIAFRPEQIKSATGNRGTFDPNDGDISHSRPFDADLFRRMTAPMPKGMPVAEVEAAIEPVLERWKNGPSVKVVTTPADLRMDAPADAQGVYFKGQVHLVASNIRNPQQVMRVLGHEAIAHYGLREMLGPDGFRQFTQQVQLALRAGNKPLAAIQVEVRRAYVDEDGKFNLTPGQESDEIAAKVVERAVDAEGNFRPGFGFVKAVYARIAEFLRGLGLSVRFTHVELQGMLVNAQRLLEGGSRTAGARNALEPVWARHQAPPISSAIIGSNLGAATSHPRYAAAKAGDVAAAVEVARALVTPDLVAQVRTALGGNKPVVVPVASIEASGRNKIPLASGELLAHRLGLATATDIVQANQPKRTAMDGLDRIFATPDFDGPVVKGQDYLIIDDTLTQGATFAALAAHIEAGGGRVVAAVALTGKQYSAKIQASADTLAALREKHGDIETDFRAATGYGFDALTESEARYLANFKPAQSVRDRIAAERDRARQRQDQGDAGRLSDDGPAFARDAALKSPADVDAEASLDEQRPPAKGQPDLFTPSFWEVPQDTRTDKFIYEIQDGRIDLKRIQQAIAKVGGQIREQFDARLAETLYPGRVAHRAQQFLEDEAKPLLEVMARNNVPMAELSDYLHARGAEERNAQIAKVNPDLPDGGAGRNSKGVLLTNAAAKQYLAGVSPARKMVLDALAARVDAITSGTRRLLVDEGLEKAETIAAWEEAYKNYVPMFRDEAEEGRPHPTGSGMSVRGSSSKRATGSTKEVTNILAHVLMQREAAITRAEKNRVAVALYGMALTNPNPDFWATIHPGMSPEVIGRELQRMGVDPTVAQAGMQGVPTIRTVDPVLNKVVDRPNPIYKSMPGAIVLKVNGDDRVLMINASDPRGLRMAENLKNLDGLTRLDLANRMVGKATRWLASVNTQYNPAFGLVNLTRDTLGGAINLSSTRLRGKTMKVLSTTPAALWGIALELSGRKSGDWGKLWRQFQADGGQTGYREMFKDANDRTARLQAELKAMEKSGKLTSQKVAGMLLGALDVFNTTLENAVRLAAYREALDTKMSRAEAARLGRELTVDFNRKGRTGREVGPLYAFFNAAVQGSARTLQALAGPAGAKIIAGGLSLGVLQAVMLLLAGYDDDEVPEFVKARALVVPLGKNDEGKKQFFTIPYPLGLHVLPNTGRVLAELGLSGGDKAGEKAFDAVGEIAAAFNPLGGGNIFTPDGALRTLAPSVVDPIIELGANKNFAGAPIERESQGENDPRPGHQRVREATLRTATGQTYTDIARIINTMTGGNDFEKGLASPTPERVRYLAQVVGGGLLREIEKTVNTSIDAAKDQPIKPSGVPVLGRFYGEVDDANTQRSRYFDNLREIETLERKIKAADKAGNVEAAERMEADGVLVDAGRAARRAKKEITALNKEAMETIDDPATLRTIDAEREAVMRDLNDEVDEIRREKRGPTPGERLRQAAGISAP